MPDVAFQRCLAAACQATFSIDEAIYACPRCGALLDVAYDWSRTRIPSCMSDFGLRRVAPRRSASAQADFSGVWRFRELLPFAEVEELVTIGEGRTLLQQADALAAELNMKPGRVHLQYEGLNPSGSFKDNGIAAALTVARRLGKRRVGCASTGNTSASLAMYAHHTILPDGRPVQAVVFVGGGKIALGKLAQALDFGAKTIQVDGDFDACMRLVHRADELGLYLVNSVNPFRLEGQKTVMYRVLEGLDWEPPDWIIVPGGNLGNSSAFGKAFAELRELGLVSRIPGLAIINAEGADAMTQLYNHQGLRFHAGRWDQSAAERCFTERSARGVVAKTVATAIEIGHPVNWTKALRSLEVMNGVVRSVSDDEILDGKALVGRHGFGCEPASGATIAGLRALREDGTVAASDRVVCILTGHALKDPECTVRYHDAATAGRFRNAPVRCAATLEAVASVLAQE